MRFLREYDPESLITGISDGYDVPDNNIIRRIVASYNLKMDERDKPTDMWEWIFGAKQKSIHEILIGQDAGAIADVIRRPSNYDYMFGFAPIYKDALEGHSKGHDPLNGGGRLIKDIMVSFAETIGALKAEGPETGRRLYKDISNDDLVDAIEARLGIELPSPSPFPGEAGLLTRRGIIEFRAVQAIYQAWRLRSLTKAIDNPKILEIGGGLGKTAYYARFFGLKDYTIIDLPFTAVSQANYLMRVLGEDAVVLHGEAAGRPDQIKLLRPGAFIDSDQHYDIVLNADSLTEMGRPVADRYFGKIVQTTDLFLSINHEYNSYTVFEVACPFGNNIRSQHRHLYALRRGYLEELFTF